MSSTILLTIMPRVADGPVQELIHDVGECPDVPRQLCPVIARHLDCLDIGRDGTPPVSFGGSRWILFAASYQRHTAAKSAGEVAPVDPLVDGAQSPPMVLPRVRRMPCSGLGTQKVGVAHAGQLAELQREARTVAEKFAEPGSFRDGAMVQREVDETTEQVALLRRRKSKDSPGDPEPRRHPRKTDVLCGRRKHHQQADLFTLRLQQARDLVR